MAKPTVGALGYRIKDLTGQTFGRLTVLAFVEIRRGQAMWRCHCSCGNEAIKPMNTLRRGNTRSCGCWRAEVIRDRSITHGESYLANRTPEYNIWSGMINRCKSDRPCCLKYYGSRGITVCERWRSSYEAFLSDMGRRPSPRHSLDRINNDGNYEPGNCRWATPTEQARNRRKPHVP